MGDFDLQAVVGFKFLNTPGTEVAPGSDIVRKDFESQRLGHRFLHFLLWRRILGAACKSPPNPSTSTTFFTKCLSVLLAWPDF